jgi:flagellar protein FliJ
MAFRFSLDAVLRCRKSFEQRERQRLQVVNREVAKARQLRDRASVERATAQKQWNQALQHGVTAVELQFELACDRAQLRQIAVLNEQLTKMEEMRRRQMEAFRKVRQQRKILEKLRERQFAAYQLIESRKTQQQMDDRFIMTQAVRFSRG